MTLLAELNNLKGKLKLLKNLEAATGGVGGGNKQTAKTNTSNVGENPNKKNKKEAEGRRSLEEGATKEW